MRLKKNIIFYTTLLITTLCHAEELFTDNFQGYPLGELSKSEKWTKVTNDRAKDLVILVETDSGNIFRSGTDNKFLKLSDLNSNTPAGYLFLAAATLKKGDQAGSMSFDFVTPGDTSAQGQGIILRLGTDATNSSTVFGFSIQNGKIYSTSTKDVVPKKILSDYALNEVHSLRIVFNNSNEAIQYEGMSLAPGNADIWLDKKLIARGIPRTDPSLPLGGEINSINFTAKETGTPQSDFIGSLCVDNLSVISGKEIK